MRPFFRVEVGWRDYLQDALVPKKSFLSHFFFSISGGKKNGSTGKVSKNSGAKSDNVFMWDSRCWREKQTVSHISAASTPGRSHASDSLIPGDKTQQKAAHDRKKTKCFLVDWTNILFWAGGQMCSSCSVSAPFLGHSSFISYSCHTPTLTQQAGLCQDC